MNRDVISSSLVQTNNIEPFAEQEKYVSKPHRKDVRRQILIATCLNIGHLIIGYSVGWSAPVLQKLQDPRTTPLDKPISDAHMMWVASILNVGVLVGTQVGATLSNIFGRKPTLLLLGVLLFTSHIILLNAKNFTTLIVGRIVNGLGVGGTSCENLVYIGEIASAEFRGIILSSTGVIHTLGSLLVFSVAPYVSYSVVEYVALVMTITHILGLFFIPESPVYHVIKVNIGHLIIGYSVGWSAPVLQKLQDPRTTPLDKPISDAHMMWVASILNVGVLVGTQVGATLSNIFGRKPTLLLLGVLLFTSHIILLNAKNFTTLIVGRIVNGLGVGGTSCENLVYIGEIASAEFRGIILSSTGVIHTLGSLLVFSVAPYVSYSVVEYVALVMTITHILGLFFIPESPVYHVIKGNDESARNTLHYLGRSKDIDKELKIMIENAKERKLHYSQLGNKTTRLPRWTWLDVFRRRRNRRALLITSTLLIIQESAGSICVMFFATTIFHKAASSVNPDIATIVLGVTQVLGILLAPLLVEKFGRKTLLLVSTSTCALCMAVLAAHFYLESINHPLFASIRWLPLAALVAFLFCYNAGLGIIPNVLVGEMFSPNVRSTGSSIAMCLGFFAAFISSLSFGYIIFVIGSHMIFMVFTIINIFGCFFTFKFVPETKGKSLTEIEAMLAGN